MDTTKQIVYHIQLSFLIVILSPHIAIINIKREIPPIQDNMPIIILLKQNSWNSSSKVHTISIRVKIFPNVKTHRNHLKLLSTMKEQKFLFFGKAENIPTIIMIIK